jgi:Cu(I)/Ag(I) efflux system membrane protein CusA/SilA
MITSDQNKDGFIAKLIEWSINNKFLVIIFTTALIALGVWALTTTKVDAIPDLSDVQVIIITEYPGQGPRIVEDQVTYPLTTKMLSVPATRCSGTLWFTSFLRMEQISIGHEAEFSNI